MRKKCALRVALVACLSIAAATSAAAQGEHFAPSGGHGSGGRSYGGGHSYGVGHGHGFGGIGVMRRFGAMRRGAPVQSQQAPFGGKTRTVHTRHHERIEQPSQNTTNAVPAHGPVQLQAGPAPVRPAAIVPLATGAPSRGAAAPVQLQAGPALMQPAASAPLATGTPAGGATGSAAPVKVEHLDAGPGLAKKSIPPGAVPPNSAALASRKPPQSVGTSKPGGAPQESSMPQSAGPGQPGTNANGQGSTGVASTNTNIGAPNDSATAAGKGGCLSDGSCLAAGDPHPSDSMDPHARILARLILMRMLGISPDDLPSNWTPEDRAHFLADPFPATTDNSGNSGPGSSNSGNSDSSAANLAFLLQMAAAASQHTDDTVPPGYYRTTTDDNANLAAAMAQLDQTPLTADEQGRQRARQAVRDASDLHDALSAAYDAAWNEYGNLSWYVANRRYEDWPPDVKSLAAGGIDASLQRLLNIANAAADVRDAQLAQLDAANAAANNINAWQDPWSYAASDTTSGPGAQDPQ